MNGLTGLIRFGVSQDLVQKVNNLPINAKQQATFLQKFSEDYIWEDVDEYARACFKMRVLAIRIFYKEKGQLFPLYGVFGTEKMYKEMPYRAVIRLKRNSDVSETGIEEIFAQFPNGKFSSERPTFSIKKSEFEGVPILREEVHINFISLTDMGFPLVDRFKSFQQKIAPNPGG